MDPLVGKLNDPLSLHKYLYARADGIDFNDPSGREFTLAGCMTVGAIVGGIAGFSYGAYRGAKEAGTVLSWKVLGYGALGAIAGAAVGAAIGAASFYAVTFLEYAATQGNGYFSGLLKDVVLQAHGSRKWVFGAGVLTGLVLGMKEPTLGKEAVALVAAGETDSALLYVTNVLVLRRSVPMLPQWLANFYMMKLGVDWAAHTITPYSMIRTTGLWGTWFFAGFGVGYALGAGTRLLSDAVIDEADALMNQLTVGEPSEVPNPVLA